LWHHPTTILSVTVIAPDCGGTHQTNPAGETGFAAREAGAEGATAPETLRQTDRRGM